MSTLGLAIFFLLVTGALLRGNGAALACGQTFPICNGGFVPNGGRLVFVQWLHRAAVLFVALQLSSRSRPKRSTRTRSSIHTVTHLVARHRRHVCVAGRNRLDARRAQSPRRAHHIAQRTQRSHAEVTVLSPRSPRNACMWQMPQPIERPVAPGDKRKRLRHTYKTKSHLAVAVHHPCGHVHYPGWHAAVVSGVLDDDRRLPDGGRRKRGEHGLRHRHRQPDGPHQ